MNLLVTGGCGFIGSNFIRRIMADKTAGVKRLINLDALTYCGNPANVYQVMGDERYLFVKGDIRDKALVSAILLNHQIDAVVDFAAESHIDRSIDSPVAFIAGNILGTLNLTDCAAEHWDSLVNLNKPAGETFRFVHVSTDEVFGSLDDNEPAFTENNPYRPNTPYAASKAAGDAIVRAYHHTYGFPAITVNCSNNYGPFQFPEKLIPLVIQRALAGRPITVHGTGSQVRDWIHVDDSCDAIRAVLAAGKCGETYNIGGMNEQTNEHMIRTICAFLDVKRPRADGHSYATQIIYGADRKGNDHRYAINCDKMRRELNWGPKVPFATGLPKTIDWYLQHHHFPIA